MKLKNNSERIGVLTDIEENSDDIRLSFSVFEEVEIPKGAVDIGKLKSLVGKRVGIARVLDANYSVRLVKKKEDK